MGTQTGGSRARSGTSRWDRRFGILLAVTVAVYVAWGAFYLWRTSFLAGGERVFLLWDDGMISMQYARNLARGNGLVWNAGEEPVQGFSNPGVTLCMALLHLIGLAPSRESGRPSVRPRRSSRQSRIAEPCP